MTLAAPQSAPDLDRTGSLARQGAAPRERLRLRTLVSLRWAAIGGQLSALLIVRLVLGFDFPLLACLGLIALSTLFNLYLVLALPPQRVAGEWEAPAQLTFDVLQLAGLLALTGGVDNPFCLLLIAPVVLSAATLEGRYTIVLASLAGVLALLLAAWSLPVPWQAGESVVQPALYRWGAAVALIAGIAVTAAYAWRAAAISARMEEALHAAQAVLAREQRLSALGGLAAAAAHELGTPLATIAIVAKEMARECPPGPMREDAELLSSQAQRCRDILRKLADAPETGDSVHARVSLAQLLEQTADVELDERVHVEWSLVGTPGEEPPDLVRHPEVAHALTSLVDNAMDFARSEVRLIGRYGDESVTIEVSDDGPGFSPDIFAKLGEPYVTSRPTGEGSPSGHLGMGLGFFIAKTLLERTGAQVEFRNARSGGAQVSVRWPREVIEAPPEPGRRAPAA